MHSNPHPCYPNPSALKYTGSAGPKGLPKYSGLLRVDLRRVVNGSPSSIQLNLDGDSSRAKVVILAVNPASIQVSRTGIHDGFLCNGVQGTSTYLFTGAQSLTFEHLADPAVRALRTNVSSGTTVRFVAQAPPEVTPQPYWEFRPGDTLSTPAMQMSFNYIAACNGQPVCDRAVTASGRMYVRVGTLNYPSQVVWVGKNPEHTLTLECMLTAVTLGQTTTCTAGTDPPEGALEVEEWFYVQDQPTAMDSTMLQVCAPDNPCTFAPPASGRIVVQARVAGIVQTADRQIAVSGQQPGALQLTCGQYITRGTTGGCTVQLQPGDSVLGWTFVPAPLVVNPMANPLVPGPSVNSESPAATWAGTLAVGGRVTVRVSRQEGLDSASANLSVTDRVGWTTPVSLVGRVDLEWGQPPFADGPAVPFGENRTYLPSGETQPGGAPTGNYQRTTITDGGPNSGYRYVTGHAIEFRRAYRINTYLTSSGPTDLMIFVGGAWVPRNRWQAASLYSIDPTVLLAGVERHETYGIVALGHQDAFMEIPGRGDACANIGLRIERVAGTAAYIDQMVQQLVDESTRHAEAITGEQRVHSHYSGAGLVLRLSSDSTALQPWAYTDSAKVYTGMLKATCSYAGLIP